MSSLGMTFGEYKNAMKIRREVLRKRLSDTNEDDPIRPAIQKQFDELDRLIGSIEERRIQ